MKDIFSIGSALVDFIVEGVDRDFIEKKGLSFGIFNQRSKEFIDQLIAEIKRKYPYEIIPGGSEANTPAIASVLGADTGFAGTVGNDELGENYTQATKKKYNVEPFIIKDNKLSTGICISLVTEDGERTMAVSLAASQNISLPAIPDAKIIHTSGYFLNTKNPEENLAKVFNRDKKFMFSFDAADPFVAGLHKTKILGIIENRADILFANEEEAKTLYGSVENAKKKLINKIAVIKLGSKGSILISKGKAYEIPCYYVKPLDTTGAGDAYAGGFLYGISKGHDPVTSAKIGSFIASKVVSQRGARLDSRPDISFITGKNHK